MTPDDQPARAGLPRSVKWGFGGAEWANSVVWTAFSTLFLYYFTDTIRGSAAFAGTLMMAGTAWNAVIQPYIGLRSDRLRSGAGRRRPFLLAAVLPYGVLSWLLFTDPGLRGFAETAYFGAVVLAWYTSLAVFYIPYSALSAELTGDALERTALSTFRTAFSQLGALVGAVAPLALHAPLTTWLGGSSRAGWSAASAICAIAAMAGLLLTWRTTRGHERPAAAEAAPSWSEGLQMLRSRSVRLMLGMQAFGWAPLSVTGAVAVYYGVHVMGYTEQAASLVMLCWFIAGLIWLPLVRYAADKIGKKSAYLAFTGSWAVLQCLFLVPARGAAGLFWALILTSSAGSMAVAAIGWSMLADLTDVEEYRTGRRREGALNGMAALAQTGLAAVAVWLAGLALAAGGRQDGTFDLMVRLLMSVGTAIWLVPAVICCLLYPVTAARHMAIRAGLRTGEGDREALLRAL